MAPRIPDLTILKRKMTSTFPGTLEEYEEAWRIFRAKHADKAGILSKKLKQKFYDTVGRLYTEEGFKVKPNQSDRIINGKKVVNFSNTLDGGRADLTKAIRSRRETVLTYIFGGKELDITKAADNARNAGLGERTAHHIFGDAEFAPFIDDIVEARMKPGTEAYEWAAKAMKSGRNHFKTSKLFAGNVEEAYRMLTKPQHLPQGEGNINIHQMEADHKITRTSRGGSRIGFAKSQGTIHGIPSDDYIRRLPLTRNYLKDTGKILGKGSLKGKAFKYIPGGDTPGITRWDALETMMQESGPIRSELTQIAMKANPAYGDVLPNVKIGGGVDGKPGLQQLYGVDETGSPRGSRFGNPMADDQILRGGRPQAGFRSLGPEGMPYDATGMPNRFSPEVNNEAKRIYGAVDNAQVRGANFGGNVPTSVLRARAKQAAMLGIAGVSVFGTGASAVETAIRTDIARKSGDWRDKAQAGISGFSLANDVASYSGVWALPGAVLSTGADGLNWLIDDLRY